MDPHSVTMGSKPLKKGRANRIPKGDSFLSEIGKRNYEKSAASFNVLDLIAASSSSSSSSSTADVELFAEVIYCCGKRIPLNNLINGMFRPQLKKLNRDIRLNNLALSNKRKENIKTDNFYLYGDANNDIDDDNRGGREGKFIFIFFVFYIIYIMISRSPTLILNSFFFFILAFIYSLA